MGVMNIPVRITDDPTRVKLEDDILGGQPRGLVSQHLAVNPDNPQEGWLWTQWNSVDEARAFAEKLKSTRTKSRVQPAGDPAILTDPRYLKDPQRSQTEPPRLQTDPQRLQTDPQRLQTDRQRFQRDK